MFERKNENKVKKQFENVGDLIIIMRLDDKSNKNYF